MLRIKSSKPLKTDNTIIRAAEPTATPIMEMLEIMLIIFLFFFDRK
jgi:hypothetical protein